MRCPSTSAPPNPTRHRPLPHALRLPHARPRVRESVVAAVALACLAAAPSAQAQPQPGEPTADVPLAAPSQAVAVEVAMRVEDGGVVCRPDRARLPPNEELTLQIVNATQAEGAFSAPGFFAEGSVASLVAVTHDRDAGAFVVPPQTTGQIVLSTGPEGEYEFACAPYGEAATSRGVFVVED